MKNESLEFLYVKMLDKVKKALSGYRIEKFEVDAENDIMSIIGISRDIQMDAIEINIYDIYKSLYSNDINNYVYPNVSVYMNGEEMSNGYDFLKGMDFFDILADEQLELDPSKKTVEINNINFYSYLTTYCNKMLRGEYHQLTMDEYLKNDSGRKAC